MTMVRWNPWNELESMKNGVLEVSLPKRENAKPKAISIH